MLPSFMRFVVLSFLAALSLCGSVEAKNKSVAREPAVEGSPPVIRLISAEQYANAISSTFGPDIKYSAQFPALRRSSGLVALGAATAAVTPGLLTLFDTAGRTIAAQVVDEAHRYQFIRCKPVDPLKADDECARQFVAQQGHLLFRRVLTSEEVDFYVSIAHMASEKYQSFYSGLEASLAGLLVAPQFIYLIEASEPDPVHPGQQRLTAISKATRLSLFLWNSPPDAELIRAAETGELDSDKGMARHVKRMLASSRLESGVRAFFGDMLTLEGFNDLSKEPAIYPVFTAKATTDSREQMFRIIVDHLVSRDGDYRDLFTTRHIFLTQNLAALYDLPVSIAGPLNWIAYDLPDDDPRAGLLTQPGFLALKSHSVRSSPTLRGKAVRELFMCTKVPDPPPNVDFSAVEAAGSKIPTARQRLDIHQKNPLCAGCHKVMDPIGLAFENFDGAGQFRRTEKGALIDASGKYNGVSFNNAKELSVALRNDPAIPGCLVRRIYEYGVGKPASPSEKPLLGYLQAMFEERHYSVPGLLETLATSQAFYRVSSPAAQVASSTP